MKVFDPVGAFDSFVSGFAAALCRRLPLPVCLLWAHAAGCVTVSDPGVARRHRLKVPHARIPNKSEVVDFLVQEEVRAHAVPTAALPPPLAFFPSLWAHESSLLPLSVGNESSRKPGVAGIGRPVPLPLPVGQCTCLTGAGAHASRVLVHTPQVLVLVHTPHGCWCWCW